LPGTDVLLSLLFDSRFTFTFAAALCADFWELAFDLEQRRGILVRSTNGQERTGSPAGAITPFEMR
jgi:hypothetical protein